jgi:hypothetical protein
MKNVTKQYRQVYLYPGLLETPSLATISVAVCFIISYCRYMSRLLFGHPQEEYTILVIGNYYTRNSSVVLYTIIFYRRNRNTDK